MRFRITERHWDDTTSRLPGSGPGVGGAYETRVGREKECTARARAVAFVALEERVGALVVLHDNDLVGLDADQLAHLDDLFVSSRKEAAAFRDEACLAALTREDEGSGVVVNLWQWIRMCRARR